MLKLNSARISNVVDFDVDEKSLKDAKDAIKSVQKFAEGIKPSINMMKMRQQMMLTKRYAEQIKKSFQEASSALVMPPVPASGKGNPPRGSGGNGAGRPSGSTKPPKKDPALVRAENASLKMDNFAYRASQYNRADPEAIKRANDLIAQTAELYKRAEISANRFNQVVSHELDNIRRSHRAKVRDVEDEVRGRRKVKKELLMEATLRQRLRNKERKEKERDQRRENEARKRDRQRRLGRLGEGAMGLNPAMLGSAIVGAGLIAGLTKVVDALNSAAERIILITKGAKNVQVNPNAIIAMKTWGDMNGVDSANYIKAIDNLKDVRERLGNTMMHSEFNKKTGKWQGGDNGINEIMTQFNWTKDDIAKFQNNPLDFVGAVVNAGQSQGMNSAQIGRLMENLGDDLMHYQRMFLDHGKEFLDTIDLMKKTGASLTEEQQDAAEKYKKISTEASLMAEGFQNNMLKGFIEGLGQELPDLTKNLDSLSYVAVEVGRTLGEMAKALDWFIDLIPKSPENKHEDLNYSGNYYNDSMVGKGINWVKSIFDPNSLDLNSASGSYLGDIIRSPMDMPQTSIASRAVNSGALERTTPGAWSQSGQQQVITNIIQLPADAIKVNVTPDTTGLSNYFDAKIDTGFKDYTQSFVLGLTGGQPASNY